MAKKGFYDIFQGKHRKATTDHQGNRGLRPPLAIPKNTSMKLKGTQKINVFLCYMSRPKNYF